MNTQQAKLAGVQAYLDGKPAAACLNRHFVRAAHKAGQVAKLFAAYYHGWHIAKWSTEAHHK